VAQDEFWTLVAAAGEAAGWDPDAMAVELDRRIRERPAGEIVALAAAERALMAESYRWDLWGAAYLINGGCSDDGFEYFRAWLIAQGRQVFEAALRDPDSLAGHPPVRDDPDRDDVECEEMLGVAWRAWMDAAVAGGASEGGPRVLSPYRPEDLGDPFDFDDDAEMRRRYPRLWARMEAWGLGPEP
jgi:hypothetical protein